jgi:glycosyltransferase involved in cell wall biosynthesis
MRMGMLASALASEGADVHWVSSTFLHLGRRLYASTDVQLAPEPGYALHLLHAGRFTRNLSFERYRFHRRFARRVKEYCRTLPPPDVIVCAFPLIELAAWAVRYGRELGVPVIVDVRDLWPDTILDIFPRPLRPIARLALAADFRRARYAFRNATALTAMSHGVLRWALAKAGRTASPDDRVFPIGFPTPAAGQRPVPSARLEAWLAALESRRLFVYVGTLGMTYDLDVILVTARLLAEAGCREPHFVLVGTGPRLETIRRAAATLPNVTAPGWLEQSEIRTLLGRAYAGLLPWDGIPDAMPNKFFEYAAAGLPVVSSAAGELNDLIRHERIGSTFSTGDPSSLEAALLELCDDPDETRRMAARASTLFAGRFREESVYRDFAGYVRAIASTARTDCAREPAVCMQRSL